ncbi:MAG TPA: hypothetical protein VM032_05675, partial [Vicinamibacterales bacterium]|nr:hypothetical protein [Vicinamibacterales bacterium]
MGSSSELTARAAWRDGARRVNAAPAVFVGLCALTLLIALPLSFVLGGMIEAHLGRSLAAETAARGTDYAWWQEFSAQATGLATTFVPSVAGFSAVLDNLSAIADNQPMAATVAGVTAAWLILWSFLSGGVLDRYARARPTRPEGFFAACGRHFWRFTRLGLLGFATYAFLFEVVHPWLFDAVYPSLTANLTVERQAFAIRLGCYAIFGLLLTATNLCFDYARIRLVVEDRRSATGALVAGVRFVRNHRGAVRLYILNGAGYLCVVLVYAWLAPDFARSGVRMWPMLALGQLYILVRHYLKLLFYASETSYFQSAFAHASYTAGPALVWPESPAAEAVLNAD